MLKVSRITKLSTFTVYKMLNNIESIDMVSPLSYSVNAAKGDVYLYFANFSVNERHNRSSHQRCSGKKGVLRNFAKFTGKHLCQSLFFNKVASGLQFPPTLLSLN